MRKFSFILLLLTLVISLALPMGSASAASPTTNRISGADRFQVAVNVANTGWSKSQTVFLTNYLAFADALSASPYAYKLNAPILLTKADTLTTATKDEITKLGASKVVIVGGPASVSGQVVTELEGMGIKSANITRIGGKDRYQVAENVAAHMGSFTQAVVANGEIFSDSLTIAPYAARHGDPILLTRPNSVPSYTKDALKGHSNVLVVGGTGSVSTTVYSEVSGDKRIGGANRYDVSANIIKTLNMPTSRAFVATGLKFADALTGSVLAAKEDAPLLLTRPDQIPAPVKSIIYKKLINNFTVLGGSASVSTNTEANLGVTIVLDPGHGGSDWGATAFNNTVVEKNINLAVGLDARNYLESRGIRVVMTRDVDGHLTDGFSLASGFDVATGLQHRVDIGVAGHGDVFVSIHSNSFYKSGPTGTETYFHVYTAPDPNPTERSKQSKSLAQCIQNRMVSMTGMYNRGISSDGSPESIGFHVLRENPLPSSLVELGFVNNQQDAAKLTSPTWQKTAAKAVALGILDYIQQQ